MSTKKVIKFECDECNVIAFRDEDSQGLPDGWYAIRADCVKHEIFWNHGRVPIFENHFCGFECLNKRWQFYIDTVRKRGSDEQHAQI